MNPIIYLYAFGAYVALGVILTIILFWAYVYVMGVKRTRDRGTLTPLTYYLSLPILVIGVLVDVIVNQLYFSVLCLDFTHWGTVTSRMKRYKHRKGTRWQKKVSAWIEYHIDDYDDIPGGHI